MTFDAVVLSGGGSRRLGGAPKTRADVGGTAVLARVTAALAAAGRIVVVGDPAGAVRVDVLTCESPPGGGPVAGLAAGLPHVGARIVLTVAGDLPFLTRTAVAELSSSVTDHDLAVAVDEEGRDQLLLAAWRTGVLREAIAAADPAGASVRSLLAGRRVVRLALPGSPPPWTDIGTPQQLDAARRAAGGSRG